MGFLHWLLGFLGRINSVGNESGRDFLATCYNLPFGIFIDVFYIAEPNTKTHLLTSRPRESEVQTCWVISRFEDSIMYDVSLW